MKFEEERTYNSKGRLKYASFKDGHCEWYNTKGQIRKFFDLISNYWYEIKYSSTGYKKSFRDSNNYYYEYNSDGMTIKAKYPNGMTEWFRDNGTVEKRMWANHIIEEYNEIGWLTYRCKGSRKQTWIYDKKGKIIYCHDSKHDKADKKTAV